MSTNGGTVERFSLVLVFSSPSQVLKFLILTVFLSSLSFQLILNSDNLPINPIEFQEFYFQVLHIQLQRNE